MDVILIPGFWLRGDSWGGVASSVERAGHTVHTPTLPGLESIGSDRSGIGLRDHIDAVVALVDGITGPVALVGHSGGGAVAHGVADARPDRIVRVVYVDSGPPAHGGVINDELPTVDGEIPLPDWSVFEDGELVDLDDAARAAFRERSIPTPARVATDPIDLHDERRYDVPVTVITSTFPRATMEELMTAGHPFLAELAKVTSVEIVELPTGHWPQFTKPTELGELIGAALR